MDVGGCDLDPADQPGFLIGRDMGLVAVHGLATAVADPARLTIVSYTNGWDQGGVHQRAGSDHDATLIQLTGDGLKQGPVQAPAHQLGAKADKGSALGRGLVHSKATEPAKA